MLILTGSIRDIETVNTPDGFKKEVLSLKMDDGESAFVEFRADGIRATLKDFEPKDAVAIAVRHEAKVAQRSGIRFNNLIAQTIKKL